MSPYDRASAKKCGTQSALNDFRDYMMVRPSFFAPYVDFTEDEVRALCSEYSMDFGEMRVWYDGYEMPGGWHIYTPNSVMEACRNHDFGSSASRTTQGPRSTPAR